MQKHNLFFLAALLFASCSSPKNEICETYSNDDTIIQNELKEWKDSHFGMFVHFGIYSELGGVWKGQQIPYYAEQIMNHARITVPEYEMVAKQFNPENWDAEEVVRLAKDAGMKYIVFTSKHHDGFCMFKTQTTDYNIVDFTPYGKDVLKELAEACQKYDMKLGLYYSLPDWHFPQGIDRMEPDTTTDCTEFVNQVYSPLEIITPELEEYIVNQLTELLTNYGDIETIWFDMGLPTPQQSKRFHETVRSLQPQCLISGRIMNNYGDYLTLPDNGDVVGYADVYWDNPASLYGSWGYKSWINRPEITVQIDLQLGRLFSTVSHGGVFLLNIGPKGDGSILDYEKEVLTGIGEFLAAHPDTLNKINQKQPIPTVVTEENGCIVLDNENGMTHAAFDATTYLTTEATSWKSWQIEAEGGEYEIFIEYLPENDAKKYAFHCGDKEFIRLLPGVDRMLQTAFVGRVDLSAGQTEFVLDQYEKSTPLEPLGLQLNRIIIKKI